MVAALQEKLSQLAADSESGQGMTEFVLVFPVQLFLTLTIIQFAFIVHAHIVVGQAAFMGARAAAVADMMPDLDEDDAARRVVARTVAVLTDQASELRLESGGDPPHALKWKALDPNTLTVVDYGFSEARQQEAAHFVYDDLPLTGEDPVEVTFNPGAKGGYVSCSVKYDYVMRIPVANRFFATLGQERETLSLERKYKTFRVHRVGFVATPWTQAPRK